MVGVLFLPNSAVTHIGSYAAQLGLVIGSAFVLMQSLRAGICLVTAHCLLTAMVYGVTVFGR